VAYSVVSLISRENPGFFAPAGSIYQKQGVELVLKSIMPCLCSRLRRDGLLQLMQLSVRQLRLMGLTRMLLGTIVLYWLH